MKHTAEGGSLAEEVISTIRTAQAFGTQKKLTDLYDKHVDKALRVNLKGSIYHGAALGVMFFVIYAGYALGEINSRNSGRDLIRVHSAFDFGITLLNKGLGSFFFPFWCDGNDVLF